VSANTYQGYYTLETYDVQGCSAWCNNTTLRTGFNIFVERDPSIELGGCYQCSLWGSGVDATAATNAGPWRDSFQMVIAESNGEYWDVESSWTFRGA